VCPLKTYDFGLKKTALIRLRWNFSYLFTVIYNHLIAYPTPTNLTYAWSFGAAAGICLVIQILTGLFLSMHYTAHIEFAFDSVEYIMRDVNNGWFLRYTHANGSSVFFMVVYAHIWRGLYYGSFMHPRELVWLSGVVILILMMATAFMGYVLPWGQMSFWGATVITNLLSAIPSVGDPIVTWVWGGFVISNATLNRFYTLHFILPFLTVGLVLVHLALLHRVGSNNPLGVDGEVDKIPFYPYFVVKDLFAFWVLLLVLGFYIYFEPNVLGHPDNYIKADPMLTPAHIVPEWYFLPFYAILRSIPDKMWGVVAMFGSLLILLTVPYFHGSRIRSSEFRPFFQFFILGCLSSFFVLGWSGQAPMEWPYTEIGQFSTLYYFIFFSSLSPLSGKTETLAVSQN
jgi:quinol-cytochrome oxidoreductase complex cytochrome b subunit